MIESQKQGCLEGPYFSTFAADPDLELAVRDPLKELRRMLAKQDRGMHVIEEDRVADLDAPGQAHDIEWPRTVNRRRNGTPYRLPKGTPASGCIGSARVGPELSI